MSLLRRPLLLLAAAFVLALSVTPPAGGDEPQVAYAIKRHRQEKAVISAGLFVEAGEVLLHPRCINCHPAGDVPLQGETGQLHEPPVVRGRGGLGVVGMECRTCHFGDNFDPAGVPGAPQWHLAPRKMAWQGLTLGEICEQIKDPKRNGNRTLDEIVEHMSEDPLVAWGWAPGAGLEPVPGTQEEFGVLIRRWVKTGAECPD